MRKFADAYTARLQLHRQYSWANLSHLHKWNLLQGTGSKVTKYVIQSPTSEE